MPDPVRQTFLAFLGQFAATALLVRLRAFPGHCSARLFLGPGFLLLALGDTVFLRTSGIVAHVASPCVCAEEKRARDVPRLRAGRVPAHARSAPARARDKVFSSARGTMAARAVRSLRRAFVQAAEDHPRNAELVGDHAEAFGEEGRRERHLHLAAFGERVEELLGLRNVLDRERERYALEIRLAAAHAVGG